GSWIITTGVERRSLADRAAAPDWKVHSMPKSLGNRCGSTRRSGRKASKFAENGPFRPQFMWRSALAQATGLARRLERLGQVETIGQRPSQQARPVRVGGGLRRLQRRRGRGGRV